MLADEIRRLIEASPLAGDVEAIMKWLRPALRLHSRPTDFKELPLGASRMGGLPDLLPGVGWPSNPGNDGRPLEFLAQIDLAEAAQVCALPNLPTSGWFAAFYDLDEGTWGLNDEDQGAWRVIYFAGEAEKLIRTKPSLGKIEIFQPCAVVCEREDCLPDVGDDVEGFGPQNDSGRDHLSAIQENIRKSTGEPVHRLGGYPMPIQSGIQDDGNWEFLLQLDSEEAGPDWMWGDAGRLYFWMCRNCREVGNLEHVWCTLECY